MDCLTKSYLTEDPNSQQNSRKNSEEYELALSSTYHPQTDGETERVNQEVETYLWIFCGSNPSEWAEQIPMAEFVHNIQPHSTTGKSLFYLIMGYKPQALPDITNKTNLPAIEK